MKLFYTVLLSTFLFSFQSYGMPPKKIFGTKDEAEATSNITSKKTPKPKAPTVDASSEERDGLFASLSEQSGNDEGTKSNFKQAVSSHIQDLAKTFNEAEVPDDAKPGSGMTAKRVLIALAALLMEKTGCAAVYMNKQVDPDHLWIATNHASPSTIIPLFVNLLNGKVEPHRQQMIEDSDVLEVLNISTSARANAAEKEKIVAKNADKNAHWAKKIIDLHDYVKEDSDLGFIADCLLNNKIKYLAAAGPHAEMNILNKLYNTKKLYMGGFLAISKQCCLHCAAAIQAVNNAYGQELFQANGCHFHRYEWQAPNFIKKDKAILESFIGKEAYSIYKDVDKKEDFFNIIKDLYLHKNSFIKQKQQNTTAQIVTTTDSPTQFIATSDENEPSIKKDVNLKTASRFSASDGNEFSSSSSSTEEEPKKVKYQIQESKGKSGKDIKDKPPASSPKTDKKRENSSKPKISNRSAEDSEEAEKNSKSSGTKKEKNTDSPKSGRKILGADSRKFEGTKPKAKMTSFRPKFIKKKKSPKKKVLSTGNSSNESD
jgi:hypothetical protein